MENLTRSELRELMEQDPRIGVSLFMPTAKAGKDVEKNPIRFKNLLAEVGRRLEESGDDRWRSEQAIRSFLKPAYRLLEDTRFWRHQERGLALFLADGFHRLYRLPVPLEELGVVNRRFQISPLLPLLSGDGRFSVLCLTRESIRLYTATRHGIRRVGLRQTPTHFGEVVGSDRDEQHLQWHTGTPHLPGDRAAVFHGHGEGDDDDKAELQKFYSAVADRLPSELEDREVPLVLAGLDHVVALYREVDRKSNVTDGHVGVHPDAIDPEELGERAWRIVEPLFDSQRRMAQDSFRSLSATDRTSVKLEEIVPASVDGRIGTLFVAPHHHRWGRFDRGSRRLELCEAPRVDNEDLVDLAAVQTLTRGGDVFVTEEGKEMPDPAPVAAIYRY